MEGEPKKGSHNQQTSEIDKSPQVSQISSSSDKSSASAESDEFKKSQGTKASSEGISEDKSSKRRFRDFLAGGDISPKSSQSSADVSSPGKEKPHNENDKEKNKDSEAHDFHFSQELMKFNFYKKLRSNKEQVIQIGGGVIGAIFIIAGILYLLGSTIRVADNVIFGERAVISAFLILVGILIIAGIFASRLLEGSFLKSIHSELEVAEDHHSKDNSKDKKDKQKDNIDEKDKK